MRFPREVLAAVIGMCFISAPARSFYVDALAGNDASTGLSTVLAWKTLTKVNATTFLPGDSVLFKDGS